MAQKKKLQVFVSSTYEDLKIERQAAVEAILTAGHIPAGMELFAAGDQSQLSVIRRWIDESDVFLLILGGRYGSVEETSGKSYIQLEYEYAVEQGKPLFAVVITDECLDVKIKYDGKSVLERNNVAAYDAFKKMVTSRLVRFWNDAKDIKLAVYETLADFSSRGDLVGWIPGSQAVDSGALAEEIARLGKENAEMRSRLSNTSDLVVRYNGLTFEEMCHLLRSDLINLHEVGDHRVDVLLKVRKGFGDKEASLLHVLWLLRHAILNKYNLLRCLEDGLLVENLGNRLSGFGLVERDEVSHSGKYKYFFTETGRKFYLRLALQPEAKKLSGISWCE